MKKIIFALIAVAVMFTAIPVVHADSYYVIRNQHGQTGVTDGIPLYTWDYVWGPFSTVDQAERAAGTGKGAISQYFQRIQPTPQAEPRFPGGPFLVENLP